MSKDTQTNKDSVLILNFQKDIISKELENLNNNNVIVDYFDIKNSTTDLENVITGKHTNSKNYKKVIIKAHGSTLGTRGSNDETHYISAIDPSLNTDHNNDNQIKTEDFIKKILSLYPDVDEIIVDACHAGSLRNSHIPCNVTAISSAKNPSISVESNQYIKWRIKHYNHTKDPCIAFGMASQLFPTTKTLMLNDKNSKSSCQIKSIAPKHVKDIKKTKEFLSDGNIAKNIDLKNKTHQNYHIQIRKADPSDSKLLHESIIKINKGKKDAILTDKRMIEYIENAIIFNAAHGNSERVKEYYMHCKDQYNRQIPLQTALTLILNSKVINKRDIAKLFFKIQCDINPSEELSLEQKLHMYRYVFSAIDPYIDKDLLKEISYDIKVKLYEACNKDKNIFKAQKKTIDSILAMMMCSDPKSLDKLIKDLEHEPKFKEYIKNSDFLQSYKKSATNILEKVTCYSIAHDSFAGIPQKSKTMLSMAQCLAQGKKYPMAQAMCNDILKNDPSLQNYYHAIDIFKDKPKMALPYIEHVEKIAPEKTAIFYRNLAEISNPLDAIKYYEKAIAATPNNVIKAMWLLETSKLAMQTHNYDLAQQYSIRAVDTMPHKSPSYKHFRTILDKITQKNNQKMRHADKEKKSMHNTTHVSKLKNNPSRGHKIL